MMVKVLGIHLKGMYVDGNWEVGRRSTIAPFARTKRVA